MDSQLSTRFNFGARTVLLLLFCYLLFRIPIAAEYYNYHSDEAYFTDNALEMMTRNDYITSYHGGDDTPRFDKPPPTAWCVVLGFKLFGISVLSSRIFFLLIGATVVWVTYRFALRVLEDQAQAVLAAVILVTNVTYLYHTGFALTDGLVTLGVLFAFHIGIAEVLIFDQRNTRTLLCLYGGFALALAVKGIIGVPPLVFGLIFGVWLFRFTDRRRERWLPLELVSIPWSILGLVPLSAWMLVEYQRFGVGFFTAELYRGSGGFLQDLSSRVPTLAVSSIYCQYPTNSGIQVFLPWTLPLALLLRNTVLR